MAADPGQVLDATVAAALLVAEILSFGDREAAEELVRNRLVAISDAHITRADLSAFMDEARS